MHDKELYTENKLAAHVYTIVLHGCACRRFLRAMAISLFHYLEDV